MRHDFDLIFSSGTVLRRQRGWCRVVWPAPDSQCEISLDLISDATTAFCCTLSLVE